MSSLLLDRSLQKEHYLGLALGNENWWRTHGINCNVSTDIQINSTLGYVNDTMKMDGSGIGAGLEPCVLSYVVSTIFLLCFCMYCNLESSNDNHIDFSIPFK